ncbi:MAG: GmrSD restriction endonuclease domain-containing protein [bacterium JZ-2024 1]
MALEQQKVHEIVKQAVSKMVNIPEFQREFVWDPEQVKKLAESLYLGYPVGSFLLWNSSEYQEAKTAQGTQASLWIVDGQQRTMALCLVLGQKPYWWDDAESWNKALERYDVMANLLPEDGNDRLEFALPNPIRRRDPRWVSIRRVLSVEKVEDLTPLAWEIVGQISHDPDQIMKLLQKVFARLHHLWQIREQEIPIIKIDHEVEDVAEIFARLNQEGTRVKEADVTLALAAVRNPGWVRKEYLPFRNDLEDHGWDLDAGILIRTMTGIGHGRARLIEVPKDFWSPENLPSVWEKARETISEVLKRLAEFGIMSSDLLPSTNSLIPLFVLHHRWGNKEGYRFGKALRWFLLANRDGRYSGSAITSLNEDVRAIFEAADFDNALENLLRHLRVSPEIGEDEFLIRYDRAGNRFLRLMLYLVIFRREARDWMDGTYIGYDKTGAPIITGFEPQWHHIYPRSVLRKAGVPDDKIHALANVTVLNERTNVNKLAGMQPSRYIRKFGISGQDLDAHLIPKSFVEATNDDALLEEQWRVERYEDFLNERAQSLAQAANEFLQMLGES